MQKQKLKKSCLFLRLLHLNWLPQIVLIKQIMLVIGSQGRNKQSYYFVYQ